MKKVIVILILAIFVFVIVRLGTANNTAATSSDSESAVEDTTQQEDQTNISTAVDYSEYLTENSDAPMGKADIAVPLSQLIGSAGEYQIEDGAIRIDEDGYIDVAVNVPE
jgi:hypothetical protein